MRPNVHIELLLNWIANIPNDLLSFQIYGIDPATQVLRLEARHTAWVSRRGGRSLRYNASTMTPYID